MIIQTIQLELSGDEEVVINDKYGKEAVKKYEFLRKYNEELVSKDWCNCDTNQCIDIGKYEVNSKQEVGFEDQG